MAEEAVVGFWLPYPIAITTPEGNITLNEGDYLTVGVKTHQLSGWIRDDLIRVYTPVEEARVQFEPVFVFYPKEEM